MIEKLEQYNTVLEDVVEILKNHSGPGDLHENTLLLVMGDHGQTTNGDHGGGTAEEVETSLFAMSLRSAPSFSPISDAVTCKQDLGGKKLCVSSIQQLDFAVIVAALLGVPFPFGSIGRVNHELYALSAGTWDRKDPHCNSFTDSEAWMKNFIDTLCVNSWQVRRYIDLYSSSSVIGFSSEDLHHIEENYFQAQSNWTTYMETISSYQTRDENRSTDPSVFHNQIHAYSVFLEKVAELAQSKWTEFDLKMMGAGLCVLFLSLFFPVFAIRRVNRFLISGLSIRFMIAISLVVIRAASFLSNSYIYLNMLLIGQEAIFLLLTVILRLKFDIGPAKTSGPTSSSSLKLSNESSISDIFPFVSLASLPFLVYFTTTVASSQKSFSPFLIGTCFNYLLISLYWIWESNVNSIQNISTYLIPRVVYVMDFGMLLLLVLVQMFKWKKISDAINMLCVLSSTILLLSGTQGPVAALIFVTGAFCIIRSQKISGSPLGNPIPVVKWSLLAVCLFFYTGHWCAFDGLRYGAAFTGFKNFDLIRQGILLSIETFGFSHVLPIFGLPLLVFFSQNSRSGKEKNLFFSNMIQVFLMYGLINAVTTTFTMVCVAIQRRHLMVWGLFAPKYVFDVVGLILTDTLVLSASLYYI